MFFHMWCGAIVSVKLQGTDGLVWIGLTSQIEVKVRFILELQNFWQRRYYTRHYRRRIQNSQVQPRSLSLLPLLSMKQCIGVPRQWIQRSLFNLLFSRQIPP